MPLREGTILYSLDGYVIAGALLAGMVLLAVMTFRLGQRYRSEHATESGTVEAAVASFVGLLIAFSYSMAEGRFATRQNTIIEESQSVGAAFLNCVVLDAPERPACQSDVARYAELRIAFGESTRDRVRYESVIQESEEIQGHLWAMAAAAVQREPSPPRALLLSTLRTMIDRHVERVAANREIVPPAVTVLILLVCLSWAGFLGFSEGKRNNRHVVGWLALSLIVSMVVCVMLDFDRPHRGTITVDRAIESERDLVRAIHAQGPPFYPAPAQLLQPHHGASGDIR